MCTIVNSTFYPILHLETSSHDRSNEQNIQPGITVPQLDWRRLFCCSGGVSGVAKLNRAGEIDLSHPAEIPLEMEPTRKKAKRMWKVVITEIQDANALDPLTAPPGAFFVSTERFARTVDSLDLPRLISVIKRMQCSRGHARKKTQGKERQLLSEKIPHLDTNWLAGAIH
jgi:hypothetical protein